MPLIFWISLGIGAVSAFIFSCALRDAILGITAGSVIACVLLLLTLFASICINGYVTAYANESTDWEVVSEEELLPLTDDCTTYLIMEHEINCSHERYIYQTEPYAGVKDLNNTIDRVKIFYADFVTPAIVTEQLEINTWWTYLFLGDCVVERYSFVLGEENILHLQTH